ncbi:DNA-binding protein [Mycolicibacterium austroafricanum]|nr:DNA-binding protein [Mycolicibacterium austroafricanum]
MRRLTATSVLQAVGWTGARLTRLERSETVKVTDTDLTALASVLRFPAAFLRSAPINRVEPSQLSFRAPKSTTESEKSRVAQFIALSGDFLIELDRRHKLPPVRLSSPPDRKDIVSAAAYARKCLKVDETAPIDNLTHLMERSGIPVLMRTERFSGSNVAASGHSRTERHLGCSAWIGEFGERPLVVLRELDSWERTRWTLAHEIGHLLLHTNVDEMTDVHEDEASRFASEFLAPYAAVASFSRGTPTLLNLLPVKQHWGISLGALLTHFHGSGGLDSDRYDMLRKQLYTRINAETGFTWGRTEPGWDERLPERPRLLSKWIEFAFGVSGPEAVAAQQEVWPADILAEFLVGQRAPVKSANPQPPTARTQPAGGVVDFASYRKRRA